MLDRPWSGRPSANGNGGPQRSRRSPARGRGSNPDEAAQRTRRRLRQPETAERAPCSIPISRAADPGRREATRRPRPGRRGPRGAGFQQPGARTTEGFRSSWRQNQRAVLKLPQDSPDGRRGLAVCQYEPAGRNALGSEENGCRREVIDGEVQPAPLGNAGRVESEPGGIGGQSISRRIQEGGEPSVVSGRGSFEATVPRVLAPGSAKNAQPASKVGEWIAARQNDERCDECDGRDDPAEPRPGSPECGIRHRRPSLRQRTPPSRSIGLG